MSAGLRRLLTAVIDAYETATGYTVIIEEHPDGTVTWTEHHSDGGAQHHPDPAGRHGYRSRRRAPPGAHSHGAFTWLRRRFPARSATRPSPSS